MKIKIALFLILLFFPLGTRAQVYSLPVSKANPLNKRIYVNLQIQQLSYFENGNLVGEFLISGGLPKTPTPKGTFHVMTKIPAIRYRGPNDNGTFYDYPNTKWNLRFIPRYYIHGAYWHNKFGNPLSHGCVNVAYKDMEALYNWADVGTPVIIY